MILHSNTDRVDLYGSSIINHAAFYSWISGRLGMRHFLEDSFDYIDHNKMYLHLNEVHNLRELIIFQRDHVRYRSRQHDNIIQSSNIRLDHMKHLFIFGDPTSRHIILSPILHLPCAASTIGPNTISLPVRVQVSNLWEPIPWILWGSKSSDRECVRKYDSDYGIILPLPLVEEHSVRSSIAATTGNREDRMCITWRTIYYYDAICHYRLHSGIKNDIVLAFGYSSSGDYFLIFTANQDYSSLDHVALKNGEYLVTKDGEYLPLQSMACLVCYILQFLHDASLDIMACLAGYLQFLPDASPTSPGIACLARGDALQCSLSLHLHVASTLPLIACLAGNSHQFSLLVASHTFSSSTSVICNSRYATISSIVIVAMTVCNYGEPSFINIPVISFDGHDCYSHNLPSQIETQHRIINPYPVWGAVAYVCYYHRSHSFYLWGVPTVRIRTNGFCTSSHRIQVIIAFIVHRLHLHRLRRRLLVHRLVNSLNLESRWGANRHDCDRMRKCSDSKLADANDSLFSSVIFVCRDFHQDFFANLCADGRISKYCAFSTPLVLWILQVDGYIVAVSVFDLAVMHSSFAVCRSQRADIFYQGYSSSVHCISLDHRFYDALNVSSLYLSDSFFTGYVLLKTMPCNGTYRKDDTFYHHRVLVDLHYSSVTHRVVIDKSLGITFSCIAGQCTESYGERNDVSTTSCTKAIIGKRTSSLYRIIIQSSMQLHVLCATGRSREPHCSAASNVFLSHHLDLSLRIGIARAFVKSLVYGECRSTRINLIWTWLLHWFLSVKRLVVLFRLSDLTRIASWGVLHNCKFCVGRVSTVCQIRQLGVISAGTNGDVCRHPLDLCTQLHAFGFSNASASLRLLIFSFNMI